MSESFPEFVPACHQLLFVPLFT
uniref:Uncharacterized protein n=1 Tax=Rhizophora mucronata TaxID=61149 RepID=A0A2P2J6U8_RHIMU